MDTTVVSIFNGKLIFFGWHLQLTNKSSKHLIRKLMEYSLGYYLESFLPLLPNGEFVKEDFCCN